MKKSLIALAVSSAVAVPAFAQNSVTLYGIIDAGINYTNNSGGHALWQMSSGILQGSRWGLKGTEDLGGGTKAIFQLENGFNVFNGKLGQGSLEFGRQAYVGLTNNTYGTLTLGRQYDPIVDIVQPTTFNGQWGAFFSHPSDIDNTDNGFRVNNSVKYVSPSWAGLQAEGFYAFGGVAGQFRQNSTIAGGLSYTNGPLYVGAAYFYARNPSTQFPDGNFEPSTPTTPTTSSTGAFGYVGSPLNMQTVGVGASYVIGPVQFGGDFTNVRFQDANSILGNTVWFNDYEIWGNWHLTPAATLGLGYTYTDGHVDANGGATPKYNQVNAIADYALSKRTDVYVMGIYQHASDGAYADIYQGLAGDQSTTPNQVVVRFGMRHKF
jgi:predicted porin